MNRRITKKMAEEAAEKIAGLAFDDKINSALEEVNIVGEKIAKMFIPAPVIACSNEYSGYIGTTDDACFNVDRFQDLIHAKLSFKIPRAVYYINLTKDASVELVDKYLAVKNLRESRGRLSSQVYDTLVALRTEKAVERDFPEALKFIEFPNDAPLPVPVFTGLREILSKITETLKEKNND